MKLCPNCGTQNADHFTQCPNCGTIRPAAAPQPVYSSGTNGYVPPAYQAAPVTTAGGWFGWSLLCGILPIIGALIMMSSAKDPSAKNFAKAMIIVQAVTFVLSALCITTLRTILQNVVENM